MIKVGISIVAITLALSNFIWGGELGERYKHAEVDMPISCALGSVTTPEFVVKKEAYFLMIGAEKRLPLKEMICMMALASGPLETKECEAEPLLRTEWTVWDGGTMVAQGTSSLGGDDKYTSKQIFKFLGKFMGATGRKYRVEVRFTKDGTPLNITNPRLIVVSVREH